MEICVKMPQQIFPFSNHGTTLFFLFLWTTKMWSKKKKHCETKLLILCFPNFGVVFLRRQAYIFSTSLISVCFCQRKLKIFSSSCSVILVWKNRNGYVSGQPFPLSLYPILPTLFHINAKHMENNFLFFLLPMETHSKFRF